jgi:hypothetical protein
MTLTVKYYKNLKKGRIILRNIKDLKGFGSFSEEKWQELDNNYIYFDEYLQKNEKGLIFLRKKKAVINEKDHLPDFLKIDVVDEEITDVWLTQRKTLLKNNLLDRKKLGNKILLPFKINFSKPWYYISATCLILFGLCTNFLEIAYLVFSFEFLRVCWILIRTFGVEFHKVIECKIYETLRQKPFNLANEKSVARLKTDGYGYYLDYISLYFNKSDNFLPVRIDLIRDSNILIFPSENTTDIKGYMNLLEENNINLMDLKEEDIDILKFNFGH